jgi:2,5-furandicarboxylate decarboxylase 1
MSSPRASVRSPRFPVAEVKDLGGFLDSITAEPAEYRSVSRAVNPMDFDVTAVLEHLDRRGQYPAVMFESPLDVHGDPSLFPVVSNLWATRERCARAVGVPPGDAGAPLGLRFAGMVDTKRDPVVIRDAPVQANIWRGPDADLWRLPVVRHSEMDLGGVLTMALSMHAPGEDFYNVTFVKQFAESPRGGGVTIHSAHMSRMLREWQRRGETVPVVNILGHHPAFWIGTLNNTPYGDNEYATAGGFLDQPVRLAPSVTWGEEFLVPADAEIIVEGEITPGEVTIVDPFGEISRQYQPQELAPMMRVTAITFRDGAIMQDVFSGHREHMLLGSIPREGTIYKHLAEKIGTVTAVNMPFSGCGRYSAYISIRKGTDYQGKLAALQAAAHVPNLQVVVVVDDDIDVFNEEDVLWAVNTYVDPSNDIDTIKNLRPPTDPRGLGSTRVLIDATRPTHIAFPTRLRVPPAAMARVVLEEWLDQAANRPGADR